MFWSDLFCFCIYHCSGINRKGLERALPCGQLESCQPQKALWGHSPAHWLRKPIPLGPVVAIDTWDLRCWPNVHRKFLSCSQTQLLLTISLMESPLCLEGTRRDAEPTSRAESENAWGSWCDWQQKANLKRLSIIPQCAPDLLSANRDAWAG